MLREAFSRRKRELREARTARFDDGTVIEDVDTEDVAEQEDEEEATFVQEPISLNDFKKVRCDSRRESGGGGRRA